MAHSRKWNATMGAISQDNVNEGPPQKGGVQPPGNGETPMTRAWRKSTARKSASATRKRQSKYSRARNEFRPDAMAAKGTFEVRCANLLHASPNLRWRLASIDRWPRSDKTRNVPKRMRSEERRVGKESRCRCASYC